MKHRRTRSISRNKNYSGHQGHHYYKKKTTKKESTMTRLKNWSISILLAAGMLWGLQCYSASCLKFAQVSDVHFFTGETNTTFKLTAESSKLLDDAVDQINSTPNVSFVMFTGDLIDKAFEKELNAFLPHAEKLNVPWYFTFGNHDTMIGGYLTPITYMEIVKKHNHNFVYDKPYYSFVPQKGYKAIVLDTIIRDRLTSNGRIEKEQLDWLDKEIAASPKDVILIFMHVPIVEPFSSPGHRLLNAQEVENILNKYKNPIAVFQGHYHGAMIKQKGNIVYISSPALVSYPNAFRMITITNTKNKVTFDIQMKETRLKNLQKLAKLMVFASSVYTGEEDDQNAVITIKKKR